MRNCAVHNGPIQEWGWRCIPARVEGEHLVGTLGEGEGAQTIGVPVDVCSNCLPYPHPKEVDNDDNFSGLPDPEAGT